MKIFNRNNQGFTLIELLVVVAIISLLASVILTSLSTARAKGRDAKRALDIKEVMKALELYYSDNGSYPPSGGGGDYFYSGNPSLSDSLSNYIESLPSDPLGDSWNRYVYIKGNSPYLYAIRVRFETIHQNSYLFGGNTTYGAGWCLTGANVYYGWWGPLPQCSTIPNI